MTVPKFPNFFLPVLKCCEDQKDKSNNDTKNFLIEYFNLTEADKFEKTKNGGKFRLNDRNYWARKYLVEAGLLKKARKGYVQITPEGLKVLNQNLEFIDRKFLLQYESFQEFQNINKGKKSTPKKTNENKSSEDTTEEITPEEIIDNNFQIINNALSEELREQILSKSPEFFENLVVDLLNSMGYGGFDENSSLVTKYVKDGGIDGIIKEDKLGLNQIFIQAKRNNINNTVGVKDVREFSGVIGQKNNKGVIITTSSFSKDAYKFVKTHDYPKIVLIDGEQLTNLMIKYNVGVSIVQTYQIKKIDIDYFEN